MSEQPYHPCRYCTDKAVCRGECAKASAYINKSRREFSEQMAAQRKKREGTDCHVGRRPPRNDG